MESDTDDVWKPRERRNQPQEPYIITFHQGHISVPGILHEAGVHFEPVGGPYDMETRNGVLHLEDFRMYLPSNAFLEIGLVKEDGVEPVTVVLPSPERGETRFRLRTNKGKKTFVYLVVE